WPGKAGVRRKVGVTANLDSSARAGFAILRVGAKKRDSTSNKETDRESTRHTGSDGSEAPMHPLTHRLQGLEAISRPRCMNADDFRVGVFHGDEDNWPG